MSALATAPGVVKKSLRIYVTQEDVAILFGCGKSKAYQIVREVNECAKKRGNCPLPTGKANKYLFSDIYDIPIDEVNSVISRE
jgi:DNA polymerase/3'-5' exonuclease PolX